MDCELGQPLDEREHRKLTEDLKHGLPGLITDVESPLDGFTKKDYEKTFLEYVQAHEKIWNDLETVYVQDGEQSLESIATEFAAEAEKDLDREPKKRRRSRRLLDFNMILVAYLFPALLEQKQDFGKCFAKAVQRAWKERFPRVNLKLASYGEIQEGFKKSYCYISTAVCQSLHKDDDCEELALLRDYRDGYMMGLDHGKEVIREYYDVAPTIVKHINREERAEEIYQNIYEIYLEKCIRLIRQGKNEQCRKVYTNMVYDLEEKYFL